MAVTEGNEPPVTEAKARSALLSAAVLSAVGIALAGTVSDIVGGLFVAVGWARFAYALHVYGRAGAVPRP